MQARNTQAVPPEGEEYRIWLLTCTGTKLVRIWDIQPAAKWAYASVHNHLVPKILMPFEKISHQTRKNVNEV